MLGDKSPIPIVQVSIDSSLSPEKEWAIGAALAPLRSEGVLLISVSILNEVESPNSLTETIQIVGWSHHSYFPVHLSQASASRAHAECLRRFQGLWGLCSQHRQAHLHGVGESDPRRCWRIRGPSISFALATVSLTPTQQPAKRKAALFRLTSHPGFRSAHPREEHFVPLYVAAGAAAEGGGDARVISGIHGAKTIVFGV